MGQKIKDFLLLLKNDVKFMIGTVIALCSMLFLMFGSGGSTGAKKALPRNATQSSSTSSSAMAQREAYDDIMVRFKSDLDETKTEIRSQKQSNDELKKSLSDMETRTATILGTMLKEMSSMKEQTADAGKQPRIVDSSGPAEVALNGETTINNLSAQPVSMSSQELESFGNEQRQIAPPPLPEKEKLAFIGAGDSVKVKLLAGVNAPTDGAPYPVVFKLTGDVVGPDGSTLPLGEARLIAAAQGSLTDSRALFRLTSVNLRLPDGRRKVLKTDGWIVGEDGIRGMSGILIDPIGKAIAGAGFAAGLSAAGNAIAQSNTRTITNGITGSQTTFLDGNVGQYAGGKALSGAASEWSGIIKDRLSELVPVVQVMAGRESTAVFARSLTIDGLYDALNSEDEGFGGVD